MDKIYMLMFLLLFMLFTMVPLIMLANYFFNDDPDDLNDLSAEKLRKLALKQQLLESLATWIEANHLNHDEVAARLGVRLNRVSDITHQRYDEFTVDRLIELVARTGQEVKLTIHSQYA